MYYGAVSEIKKEIPVASSRGQMTRTAIVIIVDLGCGLACAYLFQLGGSKWWKGLLLGIFANVFGVLIAWFMLGAMDSAAESVKRSDELFHKNAINLDPAGRYKAVIPKSIPRNKLHVIAMEDGQQAKLTVMYLAVCNYPGMPRLLWVFPTKAGDGTVRWNAQDSDGHDVDLYLLEEGAVVFISKDFVEGSILPTVFWDEPELRVRVTRVIPAFRSSNSPSHPVSPASS